MTMRWSCVGRLGPRGALGWGGDWGGNVPASGTLPDIEDTRVYRQIRGLAQEGQYEGRRVDWGAYAIKVNGPELMSVLTERSVKLRPEDRPRPAYPSRKVSRPRKLRGADFN